MIQKAMVMAAGVGSRLEPLTQNLPKPLVPILQTPVMDILLENLKKAGITGVIANTHYLAEQIQERYSNNSPVDIDFNYIYEENLSGTAGGVKKCEFFFKDVENFLVVSADGLHDTDIKALVSSHINSGCIATMGITQVAKEEVSKYGVVVTDKNGIISEFQEKPKSEEAKSNFINTGIYVFNKKIFEYIPSNETYDFARNVFPSLLKSGEKINTFSVDTYWSDIGTINQYIESNFDALENKILVEGKNIIKENNNIISIGENCEIAKDITIKNHCIIGNNCFISDNVTLENVILWDDVEISSNVNIKNCVIANGAIIKTSIENKVIGPNSFIEEDILLKA